MGIFMKLRTRLSSSWTGRLLAAVLIGLSSAGCGVGITGRHVSEMAKRDAELFHHRARLTEDLPVRSPDGRGNDGLVRARERDRLVAWVEPPIASDGQDDASPQEQLPHSLGRGTAIEFTEVYKQSDWRVFGPLFLYPFRTEYAATFREVARPECRYVVYRPRWKDFLALPLQPVDEELSPLASTASPEKSATASDKSIADSERPVRHVRLTCRLSDNASQEEFDVCGVSAGLGVDGVPGRTTGLQWGALMAHSKSVSGVQGSFVFSGAGAFSGLQCGTIATYARRGAGLQVGAVCIAEPDWGESGPTAFSGIQLGALCNLGSGEGMQISLGMNAAPSNFIVADGFHTVGYFEHSDRLRRAGEEPVWRGVQIAGIANTTIFLDGVQAALFSNYAGRCRGLQLGALNRTDELHGVQIGLVNVADSGSGLQIGLINSFGSDGDRLILPFLNARF